MAVEVLLPFRPAWFGPANILCLEKVLDNLALRILTKTFLRHSRSKIGLVLERLYCHSCGLGMGKREESFHDAQIIDVTTAASYLLEFEVLKICENALSLLKFGFDTFEIIKNFKSFGIDNLFHELYYTLTPEIVLNQFDENFISKQQKRNILYDHFKSFIRSRNNIELKEIMRFITGSTIVPVSPKIKIYWETLSKVDALIIYKRLPYASTCSNILWLCESYNLTTEGFLTFKTDLMVAFTNHEGFSEAAYARNFDQNLQNIDILLGHEESNRQQAERSSTSTIGSDSAFESANYTNPIQIDNEVEDSTWSALFIQDEQNTGRLNNQIQETYEERLNDQTQEFNHQESHSSQRRRENNDYQWIAKNPGNQGIRRSNRRRNH